MGTLLVAGALLSAVGWAALTARLLKQVQDRRADDAKRQAAQDAEQAKRSAEARRKQESDRQAREAKEFAQKKEAVQTILNADPILAKELLRQCGYGQGTELTDEVLNALTKKLPKHMLDILIVASTQKQIDFDLQVETKLDPVLYPTKDIEPVPMNSLEQLSDVLPEQMIQDDDTFYRQLTQDELLVLQPYERRQERKTLHILLDMSSSMTGAMRDGRARHDWSRGVTISLLVKAVRGEAKYMLRGFAGQPRQLMSAITPEEAQQLIQLITACSADGNNTNIRAAVYQAVSDIRGNKLPTEVGDILLISDGEDQTMNDTANVKALLGNDLRLHVVMIGRSSSALQAVATTYQEFM